MQGGDEVLNIGSCRNITSPKTSAVIAAVEAGADQEGMKTLKFFNRKIEEMVLTPGDLLEVVDGESREEEHDYYLDYIP